ESDAVEPASPKAAAVPIKAALASGDIPVSIKTGAYNAAKIGIVPNDVPIPIVINNPTLNRTIAINQGESPVMATVFSTNSLIAPVSVRTLAYPEAINMTDRKSTRLNSSHVSISYAVFCLKHLHPYQPDTLSLHDALPISKIGIVPNDVPIPIVINNPTLNRTIAINQGESPVMATVFSTNSLIAPVSVRTLAYPEAINMTKAIIPIIPIPSWTTFSPSLISTTRPRNMTIIPLIAPTTKESKYN